MNNKSLFLSRIHKLNFSTVTLKLVIGDLISLLGNAGQISNLKLTLLLCETQTHKVTIFIAKAHLDLVMHEIHAYRCTSSDKDGQPQFLIMVVEM